MTITLLAPDGVPVTAKQERQARAAAHGGGSGRQLGGRSGWRVDTAANVLTATSTTWTLGPCAAMIDPLASTHQGMYGWSSDANITGSVDAADATYARKDIVYIRVNDSSSGDGSGQLTANVYYLAGNATATPEVPTVPQRGFLVGVISVPIAGGGSPTVQLNPARYVAAGAPLPIESQAAQDALTQYPASEIIRTDDKFKRYISDGTNWLLPPAAQGWVADSWLSVGDAAGLSAQVVLQGILSFKFRAGRRYRIGFDGNYYTSNADTVVLFKVATCAVGDTAGSVDGLTVYNQTDFQATQTNRGFPAVVNAYFKPTSDTTLQVKVTAERVSGTGTFAMQRATATPNVLFIEDLGAQF